MPLGVSLLASDWPEVDEVALVTQDDPPAVARRLVRGPLVYEGLDDRRTATRQQTAEWRTRLRRRENPPALLPPLTYAQELRVAIEVARRQLLDLFPRGGY